MKSSWKQRFFVLSYFKKGKVIFLLLLIFVTSVLSLCPPQIISYILDNGVVKASPRTIIYCGLLLICIYAGSFFINYFISQTLTKLKSYFIADIKQDLFEQILKLPMEFFDKQPTGYVLERIKETDTLNVFFSPIFVKFITSVLSFIGALALVLSIRWEMAIVILLFLPVIYYFTNYSNIQIKKASKILLETTAKTSGQVQENIGGISAIKELMMEKQRSEEISKQLKSVADKSVKSGKIMNLASEGIIGISNIAAAILIICSGLFIVNGKMSLGDYWAVSQYAALVFAPVQLLSSISVMVQPGIVALTRIDELWKIKTEDEISGNKKTGKIEDVVFSDVSFGYDKKPVIQHFNMETHKNTKIVLLGKNGSGKTTIAKLLLGFYKNYSGSIRINDVELRDISLSDLRSRIGSVAQNIFLFSGTLLDNIRYIAPELKEQEVISVLKQAGLDISEFEDGLNSLISENGKNLSGGQRQKIALARMIVKNPDVMIFDEATANLDITSSDLLKESIKTYFDEKICLIITHDKSMTSIADTVINLSD